MRRFSLGLGLALIVSSPVFPQTPSRLNAAADASSSLDRVAEPSGPISLNDALTLALRANPEIAVASREVEAAGGLVLQAGSRPNPQVEALAEDTRQSTRTTTLQINQPIELGGKRAARIEAAERGRDAAEIEVQAKRAELRAAVTSAFYDVLAAQDRHALALALLELAQRGTTAASRRVTAGRVSPIEETKARVAEAGVRVELQQIAGELTSARRRLAALWTNTSPRFERVEGRMTTAPPLPELAELMRRLAQSPMLARSRMEVERRAALTQVERTRQVPDLTLSLGAKREEEFGRNQAIFGIAIPLPLFDRNEGNVLAAQRRADQARDELAAVELRLASALGQAYERLRSTRLELELIEKDMLPGAQSAHDAISRGFDLGKFGFLDVLDAQRTLFQTRSQHLRALAEAYRAAAEIERLVGKPQSNDASVANVRSKQ